MSNMLQKAGRAVEDFLAAAWKPLLLALVVLACTACAYTAKQPDGSFTEVGQDIVPGVTIGADTVGAALEAAQEVDPGEVIEKVQSGDWWGVGAIVLAAVGVFAGGLAARRKWRKTNA